MNKRNRTNLKVFTIAAVFIAFAFVVLFISSHPNQEPPLPFDTNGFAHTTSLREIILAQQPTNQTFFQRIGFALFKVQLKFKSDDDFMISFPPTSISRNPVQVLLNTCMNASGTRYFMPPEVACGFVQFGHTNTLEGKSYVEAVETALENGDVEWYQQSTKSWHKEHLALLRFPEQKVIVVLPKSETSDFLRTNRIDPARFRESR